MISQKQAREFMSQWAAASKKIEGLDVEQSASREFGDAVSMMVWTLIQLKTAGYRLSETDFWYHPAELN